MPKFDLSISLVSHNSSLLLENCLKSIYENTKDVKFEIFLVDNASSDGINAFFTKERNQAITLCNFYNLS